MTSYEHKWLKILKSRLLNFYGNRCNNPMCKENLNTYTNLEFAHIRCNGLNGMGRGSHQRILSINRSIKNMKNGKNQEYLLLCKKCHKEFDDNR